MLVQTPFDWYVVFYRSGRRAAAAAILATAVVVGDVLYDRMKLSIPTAYIALLGTAISLLLAFKNTQSYERWWEARRLWGELVNGSRTLARLATAEALEEPWRRRLVTRQVAFVNAARLHLRKQGDFASLAPYLAPEELARVQRAPNVPAALLAEHSRTIAQARREGAIDGHQVIVFEQCLAQITASWGGCERIKNTPFPRQYDDFAQVIVWLFAALFPFAMVQELGYWTIPGSVVMAVAFQLLEGIGRNIQDPFENTINDTPMTAICRNIERDLLAMLGEDELPAPLTPQRGVLM